MPARRVNFLSFVVSADTGGVQRGLRRGEQSVGRFENTIERSMSRVRQASNVAFAALSGIAGFSGVGFIQRARDLDVYARSVGLSVQEMDGLSRILMRVNLDASDAQDVIKTLTERITDARLGTATYAEAFERLNIEIEELDGTPLENFLRVFGAASRQSEQGVLGLQQAQFNIEELTGANTSFILGEFRRLGEDGVRNFIRGFTEQSVISDETVSLARAVQESVVDLGLDIERRVIAFIDLDTVRQGFNILNNVLGISIDGLFTFYRELLLGAAALRSYRLISGVLGSASTLAVNFSRLVSISGRLIFRFGAVAAIFAAFVQLSQGGDPTGIVSSLADVVKEVVIAALTPGFITGIQGVIMDVRNYLRGFLPDIEISYPSLDTNAAIQAGINNVADASEGVAGALNRAAARVKDSEGVQDAVNKLEMDASEFSNVFTDFLKAFREFTEDFSLEALTEPQQREQFQDRRQGEQFDLTPRNQAGFVEREVFAGGFRGGGFGLSPNEPGRFGPNTDVDIDVESILERGDFEDIAEQAFGEFSSSMRYAFQTGDYENLGQALLQGIQSAFIGRIVDDIGEIVGNLFEDVFEEVGSGNIVQDLIDAVGNIFNAVFEAIGGGGGGGGFLGIFHEGGIVPGLPGQEVPILAEAGERIIPVDEVQADMTSSTNIELNFLAMTQGDFKAMLLRELPDITEAVAQNFYNRGLIADA